MKQYNFGYDIVNQNYFLKTVTMSGRDNEKLNAQKFEWGNDNQLINVVSAPNCLSQGSNSSQKTDVRWISSDINSDGLSDLTAFYKINRDGSDYSESYLNSLNADGSSSFTLVSTSTSTVPSPINTELTNIKDKKLFMDLGAHNKVLVYPPYYDGSQSTTNFKLKGVDFNLDTEIGNTLNCSAVAPTYTIEDINNDGKDEIIYIEKGTNTGTTKLYISNINLLLSGQNYSVTCNWHETIINTNMVIDRIFVSDFDNDGLKDILLFANHSYKFIRNNGGAKEESSGIYYNFTEKDWMVDDNFPSQSGIYNEVKPGDFNGDGLTDFLLNDKGSALWYTALNTGNWDFSFSQITAITALDESYTTRNDTRESVLVTDFNHDGKSDIVLTDLVYASTSPYNYIKTNVIWYKSTGNGFVAENSNTIYNEDITSKMSNCIGDFDGDGNPDVMMYKANLYNGGSSPIDNLYFARAFNADFNNKKIKTVTDGFGNTETVVYQPITYETNTDNSVFFSKGGNTSSMALTCVKSITQTTASISYTTNYTYAELQNAPHDKGFLGFKTNTIINPATKQKIIFTTTYKEDAFLPDVNTTEVYSVINSELISKTTNKYFNNISAGVYSNFLMCSLNINELTGSSVLQHTAYDTNGNLTINEELVLNTAPDLLINKVIPDVFSYNDWSIFSKSKQTATYKQVASWCPNAPEVITITKTKTGDNNEYKRVVEFSYDTSGHLTQKITDKDDANQLTVIYSEFNPFGTPYKTETKAGCLTRTEQITITDGRFLQSKTDVAGNTTNYEWDEDLGRLTSETNRLGTTSYSYNGFGKVTSVKYPTNLRSATAIQWAEAGNAYNAAFYIYKQSSGTAPVYTWYDNGGRQLVAETVGFDNKTTRVFTEYYPTGELKRVSEPTFGTTPTTWAATYSLYDDYGRVKNVQTPYGETNYSYLGQTTTVTSPTGTTETINYLNGLTQTSKVNGKAVNYTYYPSGQVKTVTPQDGQAITMHYDLQGNRTHLIDPDAGTVRTAYNGYGELLLEKQLVHNATDSVSTSYTYEGTTGMLQTKVRDTETTIYGYDNLKRLSTIEIAGKHKQTLTYGDYDRVTHVNEEIDDRTFTKELVYDNMGRVRKEIFPSGYSVTNTYDQYSNLAEVNDANHSIYKPIATNARGQLTQLQKGTVTTTFGYNSRGMTETISAPDIVDMEYAFNAKANTEYRIDHLTNQREDFVYNTLNQLTNWDVTRAGVTTANSITYNAAGNIQNKTDIGGTMTYGEVNGKPHALTTVSNATAKLATADLTATYTSFKKLATLSEGNKGYILTYGVDEQRRKSVYKENGVTKLTHYYAGNYEEEVDALGNVRQIHYLSGGIMIRENGVETLYYSYVDNQGSLIALTNETGTVVEKYAYDPWGARRNPDNWTESDSRTTWIVNRGYTGHEHLDKFNIINMNGRIYDPLTAQFFSPDPFIQAPDNWLNYNRYSYCFGNPLIYTDPSGYQLLPADEGRAVDAYGSWSTGVDFMTDYKNQRGAGGGGANPNWYNAYIKECMNGYNDGMANFLDELDEQSRDINFNGILSLTYYTTSSYKGRWQYEKDGKTYSGAELVVISTQHTHSINVWGADKKSNYPSFYGLPIVFTPKDSKSAYYENGEIHTTKETYQLYLKLGQNSKYGNLLMHEYGHYLQEQKFGKLFYYTVGVSSKISWGVYMQIFKHPEGYRNTLTEVHANALAYEFFVPSFWDFKKYPITVKPESENLYPKY
jgi:RHS repeat-associated protein